MPVARMPSFANRRLPESPDSERHRCKGICIHRGPSHQGARRVGKARWQATRWLDANSVAARQALDLGRHSGAHSHVSVTAHSGGAAAEQAAGWKTAKYDLLAQTGRLFQPIAAETLGPLNQSSIAFFSKLGRNIASISGDNRERP